VVVVAAVVVGVAGETMLVGVVGVVVLFAGVVSVVVVDSVVVADSMLTVVGVESDPVSSAAPRAAPAAVSHPVGAVTASAVAIRASRRRGVRLGVMQPSLGGPLSPSRGRAETSLSP
jgi:hypothetical protein